MIYIYWNHCVLGILTFCAHPSSTFALSMDNRKYQMVLGMLHLSQVVTSLNHFGAAQREGHLKLALRAFGYIKQTPNKVIAIDSRSLLATMRSSMYFGMQRHWRTVLGN